MHFGDARGLFRTPCISNRQRVSLWLATSEKCFTIQTLDMKVSWLARTRMRLFAPSGWNGIWVWYVHIWLWAFHLISRRR